MKKVRRFNGEDGSEVSDENLNKLRQDQTERMARMARGENGDAPAASASRSMAPEKAAEASAGATAAKTPAAASKPQNFKSAFAEARSAGDKTFEFGGKKYTTELAKPSAPSTPSAPAAAPKTDDKKAPVDSKEEAFKKADAEARSPEGQAKRSAMEKSQAIENVYPEQALLGGAGFGIKSIAKAAKGLANRRGVEEFVKRGEPIYREPKLEILKDISKPLALPKPTPRLGYDKAGAKAAERGRRAEGRQAEMLKENARRSGLREDASAETSKAVRDKLGGKNFTVKKHGGSVKGYASGGSVSASNRGDGIAQRGKTRGKMC